MLNPLQNEDYSELIHSIREVAGKITVNEDSTLHLNQLIEQIGQTLDFFSNLKNAVDKSIVVAATNACGQIIYVNDKFCEISKYRPEELIGKTHGVVNSGYHDKSFFQEMWRTINKGEIWEGEVRNRGKNGNVYWLKSTIVPFCDENNKPYMFIALRTDITKGKENEEKLISALKNDFNMVVSTMQNFVFKLNRDNFGHFIYLFCEGKLAHQLGVDTNYIDQKTPREVFTAEIADILEKNYEKSFMGQTTTYNYSFRGRHILTTLSPICIDGNIEYLIGCSNDITELNQAKQKVEFLALHDTLTQLPNRRKFMEDITKLIENRKNGALLFLDLDRFKYINDSLGHTFGDQLLKTVTERLQKVIGPNGYFYRFAGDEFIVLLPDITDKVLLGDYASKLLDVLRQKIQLKNTIEVYTTGSIGISIFPDHGENPEELVKNADSAMYAAKKEGKNSYKIYNQTMKIMNQEYIQMETYLQTAIENEEFYLVYQPKLNIKSNRINSMEVLLRWKHPIMGNVPPDTFIPLAEETGAIWQIDEWVLQHACIQNKKWNTSGTFNHLRVAVNISALQFSHPNFVNIVDRVLNKTDLAPELLELEITETAIIENTEECLKNVEKLREKGIKISIDDFGTGFTSLNYLKKFPYDSLKIDQSYIRELDNNKEDMAIVKTIIALAHELDLKVIAEGVEDKHILECLRNLGCDEIQGYYVSRPLPKDEFEKMLTKQSAQNG